MKLPPPLDALFSTLKHESQRLKDRLHGADRRALTQLVTPELGNTPKPLKRILEPVVAVAALAALLSLFALGVFSFATLMATLGLAYAILTYVFGLELTLAT